MTDGKRPEWLLLEEDPVSLATQDWLKPGNIIDVGGCELHTYRVVELDLEHRRVRVEEL